MPPAPIANWHPQWTWAVSNCAHRPLKRYIRFVQLLVVVVLNSRIGFLMCRKRRNDRLDYSCASFGPTCCWMTPGPQTQLTTTRRERPKTLIGLDSWFT